MTEEVLLRSDGSQTSDLQTIWKWTMDGFDHFCSNGSPYYGATSESILSKIYSYSFGCCSDVNSPILASLLTNKGFSTDVLSTSRHVSTQVSTKDNGYYYVDADLGVFFNDAALFAPFQYFKNIFIKDVRQLRASLQKLGATNEFMQLQLQPGDRLVFSASPVTPENVVRNPYTPETQDNDGFKNTYKGTASLSLRPYLYETKRDGSKTCEIYQVAFPYTILAVTYDKISEYADVSISAGSTGVWGKYNFSMKVCDSAVSFDLFSIDIDFQYNRKIFPQNLDRLRLINSKSLTIKQRDFSTSNSELSLSGTCPSNIEDLSAEHTELSKDSCSNGTWTANLSGLQEGLNIITVVSENKDGSSDSAAIGITYDPNAPSPEITNVSYLGLDETENQLYLVTGSCVSADVLLFNGDSRYEVPCTDHVWSTTLLKYAKILNMFTLDINGSPVQYSVNLN